MEEEAEAAVGVGQPHVLEGRHDLKGHDAQDRGWKLDEQVEEQDSVDWMRDLKYFIEFKSL